MHFEIQNEGSIVDGDADITLTDDGTDKCRIDYRIHVRIGTRVFGKFAGHVEDRSGSEIVDRGLLLSKTLRTASSENINGVMLIKIHDDTFSFSKDSVTGTADVVYGADDEYIELKDIQINAMGQTLYLHRT